MPDLKPGIGEAEWNSGRKWERRDILAFAQNYLENHGFQNCSVEYKSGFMAGWYSLANAIAEGKHND